MGSPVHVLAAVNHAAVKAGFEPSSTALAVDAAAAAEGLGYVGGSDAGWSLFLSPETVEHHVAAIRTKLGAGHRADLMARLRTALGL